MAGFTYKNTRAFTLAETLISLVIIGVVAALVIPSVLKNYNDKKYNTARLKALKTFGDAGKMASINGEINGQPTARAFVENVLSKYLKIVKVCDNDNAKDCDFPEKVEVLNHESPYNPMNSNGNNSWWLLNTGIYAGLSDLRNTALSIFVKTVDGFSAKIFYNPMCVRNTFDNPANHPQYSFCTTYGCRHFVMDASCMNVIYDMNGTKAPNHVGEDVGFVTVFWSGLNTISAAPGMAPYNFNVPIVNDTYTNAQEHCASLGTSKIQYSIPNIYELYSLIVNYKYSSLSNGGYWSSSHYNSGSYWYALTSGTVIADSPIWAKNVWCVRR